MHGLTGLTPDITFVARRAVTENARLAEGKTLTKTNHPIVTECARCAHSACTIFAGKPNGARFCIRTLCALRTAIRAKYTTAVRTNGTKIWAIRVDSAGLTGTLTRANLSV